MSPLFILLMLALGYLQIGLFCICRAGIPRTIAAECPGDPACVVCRVIRYAATWPRWIGWL